MGKRKKNRTDQPPRDPAQGHVYVHRPRCGHVLPPAGHLLRAATRGGHGGGALEPRGGARDGDPAGVLEAELLLGLPQQLPEQRVVEVHHRHHVPHRFPGLGPADVHRHLPLGRRRLPGVLQQPVLPAAAAVAQEPHPPRQRPPPREHPQRVEPRHDVMAVVVVVLLLLGADHRRSRRGGDVATSGARLQAEVPAAAAAPAVAERPAPDAEQLPAEPEPSVPPREHPARARARERAGAFAQRSRLSC
uniref:Uncharacterized protein n=1 Tax=Arundo donax TaxID=35708 RepID=A0A0A9D9I0_ARUDO